MDPRSYGDVDDGRKAARASRLVAGALLAAALATLWLAMPRLFAAINGAPHNATVAALAGDRPPGDAAVGRALAGKLQALDWNFAPRDNADVGALLLHQARGHQARGAADQARAALVAAIDRHRAALRAAPAQPYVWTRLVQAEQALGLPARAVTPHWRLAVETAPWEPALLVPRLAPALALWPALDEATRELAAVQIRRAARWFPSALARQARRSFALEIVLAALADDADLLRRFGDAYARL